MFMFLKHILRILGDIILVFWLYFSVLVQNILFSKLFKNVLTYLKFWNECIKLTIHLS